MTRALGGSRENPPGKPDQPRPEPPSGDVSWEDAWREGRTRWDAGKSPPALRSLQEGGQIAELLRSVGDDLGEATETRAPRLLVPGAGSGYDVLTLASAGRHVTGLDLAPSALRRFGELRAEANVAGTTDFVCRDFLSLGDDPEHRGSYDLIWDYTFFCALPPRLRDAWSATMGELLRPNGVLLTLMYPLVEGDDVDRTQGPPFPLSREIYRGHLLAPKGRFRLERHDLEIESHPSRAGREGLGVWRRVSD